MSYEEILNCQEYAEMVIKYYRSKNNGEDPIYASDAEIAILEYDKKNSFKSLYGDSVEVYLEEIITEIGFMVEAA